MFKKIINIGVQANYEPWETYLTRKLNTITLIAISNIAISVLFYLFLGIPKFLPVLLTTMLVGSSVIILNKIRNYIWAAYAFYIIGFVFFVFLNLIMGRDSFVIMFYFPVIISMVQLLGRRETAFHLIPLGILCMLSIFAIILGFEKGWLYYQVSATMQKYLVYFNIILSLFTALAFIIIIVLESLKQEKLIKSVLAEKEILLAEVFHRVKNNLNIVTSLLNLKKNMSDSLEVQSALEDCRSRVFSMALVHQKIYTGNTVVELDFKDYINDLIKELVHSLGGENASVKIEAENVKLNLTIAIPCGLILNELITNAFKYAKQPNRKLEIVILLKSLNNALELQVKDNGPGIPGFALDKFNSLGIELIKSLSEQIDGTYKFSNNNGLVFNLKVKLK